MSTIAAIATAQTAGGIGMIRISGSQAICIAEKVFHAQDHTPLDQVKGYHAKYGGVYENAEKIDEAIALVFRAPHSYTGEDVVELSCHGGFILLRRTLRALFAAGACPAEAGEFTKRAFLNGKIDLTQAESVMRLISAQGEQAARAALSVHEGTLKNQLDEVKERLLFCASHMAAWVDYPDEEIPELEEEELQRSLTFCEVKLSELIDHFEQGKLVTEGVDTVIIGRPNTGKSTLMNRLTGKERSIVTEIAGTTRDVVEETVQLGGLTLRLADTAGLRDSGDTIESIGIQLARERAKKADFILAVFDSSAPFEKEDEELLELCQKRPSVAVLNKTDLKPSFVAEKIAQKAPVVVEMSALSGDGFHQLELAVEKVLGTDTFDPSLPLLLGERQRKDCATALTCVREALDAVQMGMTMDAVNVSIDSAVEALLSLTGEKATEAVVDAVFSQFCVGK